MCFYGLTAPAKNVDNNMKTSDEGNVSGSDDNFDTNGEYNSGDTYTSSDDDDYNWNDVEKIKF